MCAARAEGRQESYPVKVAKRPKPQRRGFAYWLEHKGEVLLVRRPAKGLLGGMLALPTGSWGEQPSSADGAPAPADWRSAGSVDHVFTHFALRLELLAAEAEAPPEGLWWPVERIEEAGLPTVFAKAAARGRSWRAAA